MRIKAGIIMRDLMGGDYSFTLLDEELYKKIIDYSPENDKGDFDEDAFIKHMDTLFFDDNKELEPWLERWFNQDYCPKKLDLSKYEIIGMTTLPS